MHLEDLQRDVESASRSYAERNGIRRSDDWLVLKLHEEVGELTQAYLARSGQARDRGHEPEHVRASFRAELADVFGQVLLLAQRFDVDLGAEVEQKWLAPTRRDLG